MKINEILIIINIFVVLVVSLFNFESLSHLRLYRYDDIIHFILYFLLSIIVFYNIDKNLFSRKLPIYILIILLPVVTEFLQKFTDRTPDVADLYYDYMGLTAGLIIVIIYKYVKRN